MPPTPATPPTETGAPQTPRSAAEEFAVRPSETETASRTKPSTNPVAARRGPRTSTLFQATRRADPRIPRRLRRPALNTLAPSYFRPPPTRPKSLIFKGICNEIPCRCIEYLGYSRCWPGMWLQGADPRMAAPSKSPNRLKSQVSKVASAFLWKRSRRGPWNPRTDEPRRH